MDGLPALPAPLFPPARLGPSDGTVHANCRALLDNGSTSTSSSRTELVGAVAHGRGQFYFEATFREFVSGWSSVGVAAPPEDVSSVASAVGLQQRPSASAAIGASGIGVIGVAVDIDAGMAFFFVDGQASTQSALSRLPGVGAYRPSIVSMIGNAIDVNFGQAPFTYAIPDGYAAWASDLATDITGSCLDDVVTPAPSAPITAVCGEGAVSTFTSPCGGGLVALGMYTTDSGNSNHSEGTTQVHVTRRGHVTLGLSAYEPTHWIIDAAPGAIVDRVIAFGYYPARIDAPTGTVLTISNQPIPYGYQWPFADGGSDTQAYVAALEQAAAAPLAMFGGCYATTEFTIGE
jgi:hypothetical protein